MVEPWLRGTLGEVDAVRRQVLHALELAVEDVSRWCGGLTEAEVEMRYLGLASVGFHLRHMVRSCDRLLTYAEGGGLSEEQMEKLRSEVGGTVAREEFGLEMVAVMERVRGLGGGYEEFRGVGREGLPSTLGGLLVHVGEHTSRHVGQVVTTARVVVGLRGESGE